MPKKNITFIFCACTILNVQAQSVFNRVYDRNFGYEGAFAVIQTLDGNYLLGGSTTNFSTGYSAELLIKVNLSGDTIWTKEYDLGPGGGDWVYSIEELSDSSFIVAGTSYNNIQMNRDPYLLKLNSTGDSVWFKRYGLNNDVGYVAKQTADHGFILAGWTQQGSNSEDALLIKTDSLGNFEWQNTYGGSGGELIYSVDLSNDNGFILGGNTTSYGATLGDLYLLKIDSVGNEQWHKKFGPAGSDYGGYTINTLDGGFLIVGSIESPVGSGYHNGYIVKTDNQGILQWDKIIGTVNIEDQFASVRQNSDSNYWVSGTTGNTEPEGWLVKFNSIGDTLLNKTYRYYPQGPNIQHYFWNIHLTNYGGAIMCGYTINNPLPEKNNMWVVKVDSLGCADTSCISTGITDFNKPVEFKIYPNPAIGNNIMIALPEFRQATLNVFNADGRKVYSKSMFSTDNFLSVYLGPLVPGMYCAQLEQGQKIYLAKFIMK